MNQPISKVLVVGATGRFAGLVVPALAKQGIGVRALVRREDQGDAARRSGAIEVALGDLRDRASLDAALHGVDGAFYIAPVYQEDEARMAFPFIDAAKAARVRRIVFSSAIHPVIDVLRNHGQKVPVEAAIIASAMEFTILHPAVFYQNMAANWPRTVETGIFAEPFSASSRISRVDYRDVADVAAMAFTDDRLRDGTFELCADGGLDRSEVVALMSEVVGHPIKAEAPSFIQWATKAELSYDDQQIAELALMYAYYDRHGLVGNTLTLRTILGHEPRSLRDFFADLTADRKTTAR